MRGKGGTTVKARIASTIAVVAATLLLTTGAQADHEVRIQHQPPPIAVAGADMNLAFVVENEGLWGEGLATLRFWDRTGVLREIVETIDLAPPVDAVVLEIDAAYVPDESGCHWYSACDISYEFDVEVRRCIFAYDCHSATAQTQRYTIPVVGTLTG